MPTRQPVSLVVICREARRMVFPWNCRPTTWLNVGVKLIVWLTLAPMLLDGPLLDRLPMYEVVLRAPACVKLRPAVVDDGMLDATTLWPLYENCSAPVTW
jgi:hypothetical protein